MAATLYVGLMSGTSMDGIDVGLVRFDDAGCTLVAARTTPWPDALAARLAEAVASPRGVTLPEYGTLDVLCGAAFADAVLDLLEAAGTRPADIHAIGSHGQTLFHAPPDGGPGYSLQIGDPSTIAARTGLPVVADFRAADLALNGHGAPLAPAFHQFAFGRANEPRAVVNIGGIANVTLMPTAGPATGFDTGPGNTLLDGWYASHHGGGFDAGGRWSAQGRVDAALLQRLLGEPYFAAPPPKSTGREHFNLDWLRARGGETLASTAPADVQATLTELTAATIAAAVAPLGDDATVAICGGGAYNDELMRRLAGRLPAARLQTTATLGIAPEWIEVCAFAWLARERLAGRPGNLPTVTGARGAALLGGVWLPPPRIDEA